MKGWATLYHTLADTAQQNPDYVSVTYGAGGSTREKTVDLVSRIKNELNVESVAHLTCVGHSKEEIKSILQNLEKNNIQSVLALRGDPPKGETNFKPHPNGFHYASELIEFIKQNFDFKIGCACYPEKHLEAQSLEKDIDFLKLKQDNGADYSITQLFFDNQHFFDFRERALQKGVKMPLIAGIMPITALSQLQRFQEMSGTDIPQKLRNQLNQSDDVLENGVDYAVEQCEELLRNGVAGIHLYTLNKSTSSLKITEKLKEKGFFINS